MKIRLREELKESYPTASFGSLVVRNVSNTSKNKALETKKKEVEDIIRKQINIEQDSIIQRFQRYFSRWDATYPIVYQLETIKTSGSLPQRSVLVDSMFMAELKNRILTSGHDLDTITDDLFFDVAAGGESYVKIDGETQQLKENDIILRDSKGILASVLYGPAQRATIASSTENVLYFAWSPYKLDRKKIRGHLSDIHSYLNFVYNSSNYEIKVLS